MGLLSSFTNLHHDRQCAGAYFAGSSTNGGALMLKRVGISSLAVGLAAAALAMAPVQKASAWTPTTFYDISLGDSLSVGFQPTSAHPGGQITTNGYADQLFASIQNRYGQHPLQLVKLGCPGETTSSMINGANVPSGDNYGPSYCASQYSAATGGAYSDQLHTALAEIATLGASKVKVITIDIGANDAQGAQTGAAGPECDGQNGTPNGAIDFGPMVAGVDAAGNPGWGPPKEDTSCLLNGLSNVAANLPTIMNALRAAAPQALIRGMYYYDPFLWVAAAASHDFGGGPCGAPCVNFAATTVSQTASFNQNTLKPAFQGAGAAWANVFNTFQTSNWNPDPNTGIPTNVEIICQWTYMCDPTFGPNIHATTPGYAAIAATFAAMIKPNAV